MSPRPTGRGRTSIDEPGNASEDEGPARKRTRVRVSRACEECRRRKERCDGGQPSCQRCNKVGRACSYHQGRKRGLRTGYVRGVEILLGLLIHSFDGAEDLILSVLQADAQQPELRARNATIHAPAASLLESWRGSAALRDLQQALVSSETEEDEESYLQNLDVNLTSSFNSLPRHNNAVPQEAPAVVLHPEAQGPEPVPPQAQISPEPPPHITPRGSLDTQEVFVEPVNTDLTLPNPRLPSNWSRLIDVYMATTHCWLPIVEKYTLFRTASLLNDSTASFTSHPTPGEVASLWAALAYGSYLSEIAGSDRSSVDRPTDDRSSSHVQVTARTLAIQYQEVYDFGHVHSFLILSLLDLARGLCNNAWLWVGKAIYVAATLNIIPFQTDQSIKQGSDASKRLFLGCFILDTFVSMCLGFRPYLTSDDLQKVGNITMDGLEEWETWYPVLNTDTGATNFPGPARALSTFNDLGYLACLLNSATRMPWNATPRPRPEELLDELIQRQEKMPALSPAHSRGGQSAGLFEPPHLKHVRVTAAAAFVILKAQVPKTSEGSSGPPQDATFPALLDTLRLLESTPKASSVFGIEELPPTVNVIFNIFDRNCLSSPEFPLRKNWGHVTPRLGTATGHPRELNPAQPRNFADIGEMLPTPSVTSRANVMAMERSAPREDFVLGNVPGLQPELGAQHQRSQVPFTNERDIQPPGPPPPCTGQVVGDGETTKDLGSGNQAAVSISHDGAQEHSGLFNQLSLLDTADWPAVSEDFMEHLGFSRNGNVVDFQSLISS